MRLFRAVLGVTLLLLESGAAASSDAPGSPFRFCRDLEELDVRERFADCSASQRHAPEIKTAGAAAKRATQQCLDLIHAGTAEKRLKWVRSAASPCIAAYQAYMQATGAASTDKLKAARSACGSVLQGLRGKAQPCDSSVECQSGLACIGPTGGPPGACAAPLAKGKPCDDAALSGGAFFTLLNGARSVCAAGQRCGAVGPSLLCHAVALRSPTTGVPCGVTADCPRSHVCQVGKCMRKCPAQ